MQHRFHSALLAFLSLFAAAPLVSAQGPGSLEASFNTAVNGSSSSVYVTATAVLPDGKTIIGGRFTTVVGVSRSNIARLNADGSVDTTFTTSINSAIYCVAVQADGKLVIGGDFTSVNGSVVSAITGVNNIARLNADGTRDTTFNASGGVGLGGANNPVYCVAVQADGKLVIGGDFTSVNGSAVSSTTGVNRIARLNADGTRDTTFNVSGGIGLGGANAGVNSVAVQADGKLVIGGTFTSINGNLGLAYVARLNSDGTEDTTFVGGVNHWVMNVAVQADGKLLLGGSFTGCIVRLNGDGARDTDFNISGGADNVVDSVAVQADGKLVLGGSFTSVNGSPAVRIARLNADGTRDSTFSASGANEWVASIAVQADGKLLLGGMFTSINATARSRLARLNNDTATQNLTAPDTTRLLWSRGGAGPELSAVAFEQSTNSGAPWTALGSGRRVGSTANWQLTGLSLPSTIRIRARGRTTSGAGNGSSGLIEQVAALTSIPPPPPAPTVTLNTANLSSNTATLTITGTGFSTTPSNNTVAFTPPGTGTVTASTATTLTVTSLSGLTAGALYAVVTTNGRSSGTAVQVATVTPPPPTVTLNTANLSSNTATLTITGTGFSTTPSNNTVAFTPPGTGTVTASTATTLTVTSLSGLTAGALYAVVTTSGRSSGTPVQVATVNTAIRDWRELHFGTPDNLGTAANTFDADGDGLMNLLEYAFSQNPKSASSLSTPQPRIVGNNFTTTFTGVSGVTYAAEWSSTLLPGNWTPIPDTGAGDQHTFGVSVGGNRRLFMRLRVTAADTPLIPEGFSLIPAGAFTMGRTSGDTDSGAPPVTVTVSAFFMGKYEVTKALWDEVRTWGATNGYTDLLVGDGKASNHPVQTITWFDVVKWCNARSQKDGLTPVYTVSGEVMKTGTTAPTANWSAKGYRLPTEAEWEKAARGGVSGKRFPWGTDTISHSQANYVSWSFYIYDQTSVNGYHPTYAYGSFPYTSPVGNFAANGYGLYDMAGNVWEKCWDWYGESTYVSGAIDPRGAVSGTDRVVRGGGWSHVASDCRAAARGSQPLTGTDAGHVGFRLARSSVP